MPLILRQHANATLAMAVRRTPITAVPTEVPLHLLPVGRQIHKRRTRAGLWLLTLAHRCGISPEQLDAIEQGAAVEPALTAHILEVLGRYERYEG